MICLHTFRYGFDFQECENEAEKGDVYCEEHGGWEHNDDENDENEDERDDA